MVAPAIECIGLHKSFGKAKVLEDIYFSIEQGRIVGLIGRSGAGKSTLIKIILKIMSSDAGSVKVHGNIHYSTKDIGFVTQRNVFYEELTVKENMHYQADLKGMENRKHIGQYIKNLGLEKRTKTQARHLSGGERRRLTVGLALITNPKIIIMDETSEGLDPLAKQHLWELIKMEKKNGKTILLITHLMEDIEALCDRIIFLKYGKILANETPQHLKDMHNKTQTVVLKTASKDYNALAYYLQNNGYYCYLVGDELYVQGNQHYAVNYITGLCNSFNQEIIDIHKEKPTLFEIFKDMEIEK